MKIRSLLVLAALAAVIAVPVAGQAAACNGKITTIGSGAAGSATVYQDDRTTAAGDINHWTYVESNNVKGLQTGGPNPILGDIEGFADPCDNYAGASDTLIL